MKNGMTNALGRLFHRLGRELAQHGGSGRRLLCEVDSVARRVAIMGKGDVLVHEASFYKTIDDVSKAGIKATLVPGSHPWGRKADGF